jgi:osmotically-inducible protein OsmY
MGNDATIREDVENELKWEPELYGAQIGTTVEGGVVTLVGTVKHYADRFTAEQVVKRVRGVRAIANELEVKLPVPGEHNDADIATAVANALRWNVSLSGFDLKAVVIRGWVTLSGQVNYGYQKSLAEGLVRYLVGVKGITNDVTVKPTIKTEEIKKQIEAAFQRQAHLDAKEIQVKVADGTVTLAGWVHSWREKDDATQAAFKAAGVGKVENQLMIQY